MESGVPIVIDNGSSTTKAGLAGQETPSLIIPTLIGRPKFNKVLPSNELRGEIFVGPKESMRGLFNLTAPIKRGIVENVQDMTFIWEKIFSDLKVQSKESRVIITEPVENPKSSRQKIGEIFFNKFSVSGLLILQQPVLSLFSYGKTIGTVLESGDGVTQCMPIFEGYAIPNTVERSDMGGSDITNYLRLLFKRSGYQFNTSNLKETVIELNKNSTEPGAEKKEASSEVKKYALPDGTIIDIGPERHQAPELLFNPSLVGLDCQGIHQMLIDCIKKTDLDLREQLTSNIVFSGGNTEIANFKERMTNNIKAAEKNSNKKVGIHIADNRALSCWKGASMICNHLDGVWISKKTFDEEGDRIFSKFNF